MPKSATGRTDPVTGRSAGFTLIEVLVVVTIAAALAFMVALRLGTLRSDGGPDEQLRRLAALVQHQCEQSMFQAQPRGVRLTTQGYDFWQFGAQGWAPLPDGKIIYPRRWRGSPDFDLVVEGHPVDIGDDPELPQLVCQPLGELTVFRLDAGMEQLSASLESTPSGRLQVESRP